MKTKLYRVLVLLVAIAMMIPSFALAEGEGELTFKITPKTDAPDQYYIAGDSTAIAGTDLGTYKVTNLPENYTTAFIRWSSSDEKVAYVSDTKEFFTKDVDTTLPSVTKKGIGEATITGSLYIDNDETPAKTATFKVTIKEKALEKFTFSETAQTKFVLADFSTPYDLYAQLVVTPESGVSYTKSDVFWEIPEGKGDEIATLTRSEAGAASPFAKIEFKAAGTVTVRAYIPGTKYEATWIATVIDKDESHVDHETLGYTDLSFTAEKVYIFDSKINLNDVSTVFEPIEAEDISAWRFEHPNAEFGRDYYYSEADGKYYAIILPSNTTLLNLKPAGISGDTLFWSGTTPVASVSNTGVVDFGTQYGEVDITVKSTVKNLSDTIKVVRLNKADMAKPYTKLAFNPDKDTVRVEKTTTGSYKTINAMTYLTVMEPSDMKGDRLVFSSSNDSIASVNYATGIVTPKADEGEVTITVQSYLNKEAKAELKLTFQKAAESKYKTFTFSKTTFDFKINENDNTVYFNATDYLTTDPAKVPGESLTWTSSDTDVAFVDPESGVVSLKAKAGTATIKVENKDKSVFAAITVNVEVVKNPYKAITVSAEAQKGLTVEEKKTIDLKDYLTLELTRSGSKTNDELTIVVDNTKTATVTMPEINTATGAITEGAVLTGVKASDKPVTVTIRNSTGSVKAEIKVTVEKPKTVSYTSLKFDTAELTVPKNFPDIDVEERHLIAVEPDDFNDNSGLIWKSSDEKVAYFADPADGTLTIAKPGTTEISVRNGDNTVKSENVLKITVVDAEPFTAVTAIESAKTVYTTISKTCTLTNLVHTEGGYNDSLIWTSENQQIALVSNNGVVTVQNGAKNGDTVKITARSKWDKNKTATITLTIDTNQIAIKSITLTQDTFELEPTGSLYLDRYVVTDPVEHNDTLFYTSDDPSVAIQNNTASVDANLLEDGEAHITVRSTLNPDVSAKFTIKLKAKGADSIAFKDAPKTFYKEMNTLNLWDYLVTNPADYVEKHSGNLVWESSDPTVALAYNEQPRVDIPGEIIVYGCLTYVQPGNVTITVTDKVSGKSAKVDLVLKEKHPVESIELKDVTLDVDDFAGLYDFLSFKPLDANFDESKLTFTSSNREVAEVVDPENEDIAVKKLRDKTRGPLLVAYKAGTTKITAYYELDDKTILKDTCVVTVEEVELDKVKISQDKYTLKLNTKMDAVVRFNVEPFNCTFEKEDLYVISADPEIVEVSEIKVDTESHKGKFTITGKKPGTAWVVVKRAKDDKALDACKVKVKAVAVKSVGWEKKNVKMYYYDDGVDEVGPIPVKVVDNKIYRNVLRVKPIINPSKAYCNVSFETSDPSVAFINDNDVVDFLNDETPSVDLICMGPGKCKITMKVDDGKKVRKAVLNVEVETKLPKLKLSEKRATLKLEKGKDTLQLRAYDANTDTDLEVKWASSNTKVAKVNVDGKVRAVGAGTATITATTKNGQKQVVKCKIVVKAPSTKNDAAKKITGDTKVTVKAGEKKALEIKVKPEGAKVTFTSSDSKIVKVTKDGTIKGIKAGKATITVKAAEGKAELKIKVVVK